MHYDHPENLRRLIRHRCQYCGRDFFADKRTGRPRLFCDNKCKDGEFRRLRYLTFKNVETPEKSKVSSKISKAGVSDRPSVLIRPTDPPVNILGEHRWSDSVAIDSETLAEIVNTEIGGEHDRVHQHEVHRGESEIPNDLSIPAFLRRRPS